jgi:hypothetical protein
LTNGTRRGEGSASRPGRSLPPGKNRYALYRRLGRPQGRSGQVRKISPHTGIQSSDRPARSQSLYRLSYPAHIMTCVNTYKIIYAIRLLFQASCIKFHNEHKFIFNVPCIMTQFMKMTNKMQLCGIIFCSLAALHVSSDIFAHHQEHLNCMYNFWYYSHVLLPADIETEYESDIFAHHQEHLNCM